MERIYETMFIVVPTLNDEERENVVEKVKNFIQEKLDGKIEKVDRWGVRKLAFKVKKFSEGDYTVIIFRASPEKINQFENFYHITQEIIRWQTFRRGDLEKKERKRREKEDTVRVEKTTEENTVVVEKEEENVKNEAATANLSDSENSQE